MDDVVYEEPRGATFRQMITALDNVQEAIVVLAADRSVQYRNRAAQALFDDATEIGLPQSAWGQLERGRTWKGTAVVHHRGEERRLRFYAKPLLGLLGERTHLVVVHDVTDVQRLQSIADAVNFSDNLGHFLSGIRHELGNPVNSIKTALTVLRTNLDGFGPEKVANYLDRVLGEVGRIEYLLHWLRSLSVDEVVTLGRVDLPGFVRAVTALVEPSAQRAGVVLVVDPPPAAAVVADVRALYQVLLNLVSNAIEALPGVCEPVLRIESAVVDGRVELAVVDNGRGMSAENLVMARRPFFTTKRTGTGLGLVIAERLLATQGGRLRLSSQLGVGTRAVVSLPRATDLEGEA
jgi:signal transduction histidine kinase